MSLPVYYPFKTRVLNMTASSSAATFVAVPARAKLLTAWYVPNATNTVAGSLDLTVNGSTIGGAGGIVTTTSTASGGGTPQQLYNNFSNSASINSTGGTVFLNAGDALGTSLTTVAAGMITWVVQEF